jgi:DNA repair and recombination protein RAD52
MDNDPKRVKIQSILDQNIDEDNVLHRDMGSTRVAYVSAHYIIAQLNSIFGFDGWNTSVKDLTEISCSKSNDEKHTITVRCIIILTIPSYNIIKEDVGVGCQTSKSLGDAKEMATKTAVSDALKRAARQLGEKLGNQLYK